MQAVIKRSTRVLLGGSGKEFLRGAGSVSASGKPVLEKEFLVYRWDPESNEKPKYQSYKVDLNRYDVTKPCRVLGLSCVQPFLSAHAYIELCNGIHHTNHMLLQLRTYDA